MLGLLDAFVVSFPFVGLISCSLTRRPLRIEMPVALCNLIAIGDDSPYPDSRLLLPIHSAACRTAG